MKNTISLTESKLKNVISESIKKILKENNEKIIARNFINEILEKFDGILNECTENYLNGNYGEPTTMDFKEAKDILLAIWGRFIEEGF